MKVQAVYTLTELAQLAGMSRKRVRTLLEACGVLRSVPVDGGPSERAVVYLSDLKHWMPEFWESCLDRASLLEK